MFLLCITKICIFFNSNTGTKHLRVAIKLLFKLINLNIPMISKNENVIEKDCIRLKVRSNHIQLCLCLCCVGYDRQNGLVIFNWNSAITSNGHVRLLLVKGRLISFHSRKTSRCRDKDQDISITKQRSWSKHITSPGADCWGL